MRTVKKVTTSDIRKYVISLKSQEPPMDARIQLSRLKTLAKYGRESFYDDAKKCLVEQIKAIEGFCAANKQENTRTAIKKEDEKKRKIDRLREKRDKLWKDFCRMPRRESFSGLHVSHELENVQQKLDELEGNRKSKRYYPKINIEVF